MSVVAPVFPRDTVNATLRSPGQGSRRRRDLPADVIVCCVIVMAPFPALRGRCVAPPAHDGRVLNLRGEEQNRETFGLPGASRGAPAFPQARVTAVTETGTWAALARHAGAG